MPGSGLNRVEGAIEVCADGFGQKVWLYAVIRISAARHHPQERGDEVLEELSELADACVADKNVESSPPIDDLLNQKFAGFWV